MTLDLAALQQQLQQLSGQLLALQTVVYRHKHMGFDQSQKLSSGSSGASSGKSYQGYVNNTGASGAPFPAGWSVVHHGAGDYSVIHNLGTTNYVVNVTPARVLVVACAVQRNSNDVRFTFCTPSTASFTDTDFMFNLILT